MADQKRLETEISPGSPSVGEPGLYLAVGTLRRSHGIRGDLLLDVLTDFPERLKPGTTIYVGEKKQPLKITRRRPHNDGLLLGFEGIVNTEQTIRYRAQTVFVLAEDRPSLPEGEYYHHQIIGLNVIDESGVALGIITEIIETGANDVYVVKNEVGREILLPAIIQVLLDVNLDTKTMHVHLLEGLVDGDESVE
jgi:16S rRNA processing protein RimM